MTFSHKCYLPVKKKNEKKCLTVALVAQKPLIVPFLPILVNFGWLSTTVIVKIFELYRMHIGNLVKNFEINPIKAKN